MHLYRAVATYLSAPLGAAFGALRALQICKPFLYTGRLLVKTCHSLYIEGKLWANQRSSFNTIYSQMATRYWRFWGGLDVCFVCLQSWPKNDYRNQLSNRHCGQGKMEVSTTWGMHLPRVIWQMAREIPVQSFHFLTNSACGHGFLQNWTTCQPICVIWNAKCNACRVPHFCSCSRTPRQTHVTHITKTIRDHHTWHFIVIAEFRT